jgi:hypothetical protein
LNFDLAEISVTPTHTTIRSALAALVLGLVATAWTVPSQAADAGRIKVSKGSVSIQRGGKRLPAPVGAVIQPQDTVVTGADGAVGITFLDNSMVSAGPDSVLTIDRYVFDRTTNKGAFESTLKKGTLAAVSGKMVKQSPEAMKVKTPAAVMAVRGTEFVVRVTEPAN